jgi:hypothetical protein
MSVTIEEIVRAARAKMTAVTGETAGYLVLGIADGASDEPGAFDPNGVVLMEDGSLVRSRAPSGVDTLPVAGLRDLLSRLLAFGPPPAPALQRVAGRASLTPVRALVTELEAALIPVNRSAARRALARLHRDVARARSSGALDAVPAPSVPATPPVSVAVPAALPVSVAVPAVPPISAVAPAAPRVPVAVEPVVVRAPSLRSTPTSLTPPPLPETRPVVSPPHHDLPSAPPEPIETWSRGEPDATPFLGSLDVVLRSVTKVDASPPLDDDTERLPPVAWDDATFDAVVEPPSEPPRFVEARFETVPPAVKRLLRPASPSASAPAPKIPSAAPVPSVAPRAPSAPPVSIPLIVAPIAATPQSERALNETAPEVETAAKPAPVTATTPAKTEPTPSAVRVAPPRDVEPRISDELAELLALFSEPNLDGARLPDVESEAESNVVNDAVRATREHDATELAPAPASMFLLAAEAGANDAQSEADDLEEAVTSMALAEFVALALERPARSSTAVAPALAVDRAAGVGPDLCWPLPEPNDHEWSPVVEDVAPSDDAQSMDDAPLASLPDVSASDESSRPIECDVASDSAPPRSAPVPLYAPRHSDVSELLSQFVVGEARSLGEMARDLKQIAGVAGTPGPPPVAAEVEPKRSRAR